MATRAAPADSVRGLDGHSPQRLAALALEHAAGLTRQDPAGLREKPLRGLPRGALQPPPEPLPHRCWPQNIRSVSGALPARIAASPWLPEGACPGGRYRSEVLRFRDRP